MNQTVTQTYPLHFSNLEGAIGLKIMHEFTYKHLTVDHVGINLVCDVNPLTNRSGMVDIHIRKLGKSEDGFSFKSGYPKGGNIKLLDTVKFNDEFYSVFMDMATAGNTPAAAKSPSILTYVGRLFGSLAFYPILLAVLLAIKTLQKPDCLDGLNLYTLFVCGFLVVFWILDLIKDLKK